MMSLLEKCAFFDEMTNVQQAYTWNELSQNIWGTDPEKSGDLTDLIHSLDFDRGQYKDSLSNYRDNKLFDELADLRKSRKKRLERIKKNRGKLKEMKNESKDTESGNPTFNPSPFWSSVYGYTGLEGTFEFPLAYYSGALSNEPGAITNNPYNTIYQAAADRAVRRMIRAEILLDICKQGIIRHISED